MKIDNLTSVEKNLLYLISKSKNKDIKWDKMPKQEVYTHLYGWDNPNVDINLLLTPKEKDILRQRGYSISNDLKKDVELLSNVRKMRKNPSRIKL